MTVSLNLSKAGTPSGRGTNILEYCDLSIKIKHLWYSWAGFFLRFRFGDRKEILRDRLEEFERPFSIDVISGHSILRDRWRNLRDHFGPSKHLKKHCSWGHPGFLLGTSMGPTNLRDAKSRAADHWATQRLLSFPELTSEFSQGEILSIIQCSGSHQLCQSLILVSLHLFLPKAGVVKLFNPRAEFATAWPLDCTIQCDLRNLCKISC